MDTDLRKLQDELGIPEHLLTECRLPPCAQPPLADLEVVAIDFEGKPVLLRRTAARAWREMRAAAAAAGVDLEAYSGFRSYVHQQRMIHRRLEQGRALEEILTAVAIPGFSEHHTGRAIDICTDGVYALEEDFERTSAFGWLSANAEKFGFRLSYPRGNPLGIIYEPWHWCYRE